MDFTFTIYFQNASGTPLASGTQLTYTGGIIADSGAVAPLGGTLTLDSGGKATLTLKHGQTATITLTSAVGKVRIVESPATNYSTSFVDSVAPGTTVTQNDTNVRAITNGERTFDFINTRVAVPPTGVSEGRDGWLILTTTIALLLASVYALILACRRMRAAKHE